MRFLWLVLMLAGAALAITYPAVGNSGYTEVGESEKGCWCHFLAPRNAIATPPDPNVTITVMGLPEAHEPGRSYRVQVSGAGPPPPSPRLNTESLRKGWLTKPPPAAYGFAFSVSNGSLAPLDATTQISWVEDGSFDDNGTRGGGKPDPARQSIGHSGVGIRVPVWNFTWTAPPNTSAADVRLALLWGDGTGDHHYGDRWNAAKLRVAGPSATEEAKARSGSAFFGPTALAAIAGLLLMRRAARVPQRGRRGGRA